VHLTIRYIDGCPHWQLARDRLRAAVRELGLGGVPLGLEIVTTAIEADRLGFRGSPTILIDGTDPFAGPSMPMGLACRVYRTERGVEGAPSVAQLLDALRAAGVASIRGVDEAAAEPASSSVPPEAGSPGL
jgi:hypothetical protein